MMLGKQITVIAANEKYDAVAIDIDDSGRLMVENGNGEILTLSSGEISISL